MSGKPFKSFKTMIAGLPVTVASDEECERASFVVCGNNSYFADDVHTKCSACAAAIVHRPYVPKTPPKICSDCFVAMNAKVKH